jgi:serine/threonine protein kinase
MLLSKIGAGTAANQGTPTKRPRGHSYDINQYAAQQEGKDWIYILKVCDLGQSRTVKDDTNLTEYVSTRWYRAPELLVGSRDYEKSVDIWALGCIIPELISGKPLFPGNTNLEALAFIIKTLGNGMT